MTKTLKINSGSLIPADTIRFIRPIDAEERTRLVERYGDDAAGFKISIQFADKSTKLAVDSLDEVRGQGIGLVNIGSDRHVVASNIKEASPFTKDDAEKLAGDKGYTLNQTFRSRIETTAGALLSSATPEQVMSRRAKAMEANGPK
ncbi:MAG: hypothetical protein K0U74_11190 [Alphaproteobacteria bacterium]|nr:hypothetical protein [Alphaproteobacteria bacterium]